MRDVYLREAHMLGRQAFSIWNRELSSGSRGSFDRRFWGWKSKDFPDATLQYAARLAIGFAEDVGQTANLPNFLESFVSFVAKVQRRDGSFDQCYPYERTPGVTYDFLSTLVDIARGPYLTSSRSLLEEVIDRAVTFIERTDELHGEIANHIAEYAFECFHHARHFNDSRTEKRGRAYLERLFRLQDREEGWLLEYDGADSGYLTRTLRYLTKCARLLDDSELWDRAARAATFLDSALMPDGSAHPILGCRSTALVYPSGFEQLAAHDNRFEPLARRVRFAWSNYRVPLPSGIDLENGIRLADDARDAAAICPQDAQIEPLQIDAPEPAAWHMPNAGLTVFREPRRRVYVNHKLGGAMVVYGWDDEHGWSLRHEDSGYLLESRDCAIWTNRVCDAGYLACIAPDRIEVQSRFYRTLHDDMTPLRMVVLRLLNLTVLRWNWAAELFRRIVVRRLMTGKQGLAVTLTRAVHLHHDRIEVLDNLSDQRHADAQAVRKLFHCRRIVGIHMASSRYFQDQELARLPVGWADEVTWQPNTALQRMTTVTVGCLASGNEQPVEATTRGLPTKSGRSV